MHIKRRTDDLFSQVSMRIEFISIHLRKIRVISEITLCNQTCIFCGFFPSIPYGLNRRNKINITNAIVSCHFEGSQ